MRKHSYDKAGMVLVLCLAAGIYFAGLNTYPLLDPDEGRYAEIAREMLELGDFITPHLNYVKYYEKPPLFYWVTAGAMALFGEHEWVVRAVPAAMGVLTVFLIMVFGRCLFGMRAGVLAGWVYLTSVVPLILARLPIIDGMFSLLLTVTWMAWWQGYAAPTASARRRWYSAAWVFMGLAVMTKGIAAVALTGGIVFTVIAARGDWRALGSFCWIRGALIFAVIVLPWHLAAGFRDPEFFHFYIVVQHFGRMIQEEHARPIWYFLVIFPFGMLFWTGLFFPAVVTAIKEAAQAVWLPWRRFRGRDESQNQIKPVHEPKESDRSQVLFLVIWAAVVVGLFSLSRSKLVPYILPAYPAGALLVAFHLMNGGLARTSSRWAAGATAVFLLAAIPVASYYARAQEMLPLSELALPVGLAQGALLLGGGFLGLAVFKPRLIPFATGLVLVLLTPAMVLTLPVGANYRKVGGLMTGMPVPLPDEIRVAEWRTFDQGLGFYTQRRTILVDNTGELRFGSTLGDHTDFFLQGEESLKRLGREGPLLVNIRPDDWPTVRSWGLFRPVAGNSTNLMVGNEAFFRAAGLTPWPDHAVTGPPLLLRPQPWRADRDG